MIQPRTILQLAGMAWHLHAAYIATSRPRAIIRAVCAGQLLERAAMAEAAAYRDRMWTRTRVRLKVDPR